MNRWLGQLHTQHVHGRRVRRLAERIEPWLASANSVLDIGCGDGELAAMLQTASRPVTGLDVLPRNDAAVPVTAFDGLHIPFDDATFDAALLIDVLHHADDAAQLLAEAKRVARKYVILKDHLLQGLFASPTLRFMDYVGNARYGVALPYRYFTPREWFDLFAKVGLRPVEWVDRLSLYPLPASLLFDRQLHVLAKLERA